MSSKSKEFVNTDQKEVSIDLDSDKKQEKSAKYERAKEIVNPAGFINTEPITVNELIGKKVVLLDFWTYSCINCQRTLPFLNEWYKKYKDQGLEILGVHTPEFTFEKDMENVQQAVNKYGVKYPVILDNNYDTWRNYQNRYWPRKYLIDIDGFIVYDHIGEGSYDETEKVIQELLEERKLSLGEEMNIASGIVNPKGAESINRTMPITSEIYFGADRNGQYLKNGKNSTRGLQTFELPKDLKTDGLYLEGSWKIESEFAENTEKGEKIVLPYRAQKVFMVLSSEKEVEVKIYKDGVLHKTLQVHSEDLYRLIEDKEWGEHTVEIVPQEAGLRAYTFSFG